MIKAAFFDIDGTLVSLETHRIPASAHMALEKLRQKGIKLFICSGRPYCAIDNLEGEQFDGFITVNGGICNIGGQTILKHPIPMADVAAWNSCIKKDPIDCFFITENQVFMSRKCSETDRFIELLNFITPSVATLDELSGTPIFQIVGLFGGDRDAAVRKALPNCRLTRWHPTFSDIVPADSDKSHGMRAALDFLGLQPEECMAFGDGANDIEMLRFAGLSIAMAGCPPQVEAAATYRTDSPDDDGIYNALKHFSVI